MSPMTACWLTAIVLALIAVFFAFALCRAAGMASRAEEARGRVWDERRGWIRLPYGVQPGPDQLTEAEVDGLDRFQVALDDIVTGPEWAAGRERMWDAVRDHHDQKGDQA